MTDRERYSAAMRQDYPKDFIPDSEWGFIDSVASWGKSNNVAPNGVKGKGRNMAKEQKQFSKEDKIKYFGGRVSDQSLTQGQRNYAAKQLSELTGNKSSAPQQQSGKQQYPSSGKSTNVNLYVHHVK